MKRAVKSPREFALQRSALQSEKIHYVYVHRRADSGIPVYVGKGVRRRAWSDTGRNIHWHRIVAKHGYTVHVVMSEMQEPCAFSMEAALIKFYGRSNLCNLTDGGDIGPLGMKKSEESRRRQSERMRGNQNTKGRKLTPEHIEKIRAYKPTDEVRAKISASMKLRPPPSIETRTKMSAALKGIPRSDEWKRKLSEAGRNRPPPSIQTRERLSASLKGLLAGEKNPAFGIPKTPAQKARLREAMLGRRFKPESIAARSGENHPRYDATVYTMERDGEAVSGTRRELTVALGLRKNVFTSLLNGSKKTTKGWKIAHREEILEIGVDAR